MRAAAWLRWHTPVSRLRALQMAEDQASACHEALSRRIDALTETLAPAIAGELHARWDAAGCQPPATGHRLHLVRRGREVASRAAQ